MFKASCLTSRNVSKKLEMYCLFRQPLPASLHFYLQKLWWRLQSVRMWNCQPPIKRQRNAEARETDSERNNKELQKWYDSLLKDHERLAQAFRNQEKETKLLGQQLEEKKKEYEEAANDVEELANLVQTKCEAIKTLEKRLVEAKKPIASLKQELQSSRNSSSVREPQHPDPPQQQSTGVSSHSLSSIHSRYDKVLQTMKDNNCSMANAYRLSGCPRSTLQDFIVIAELKKVDSRAFEIVLANYQGESVRELEQICRKSLRRYMPLMSTMRREGQLLPLKFDQRFYEWSFTCNKNGSFRSHHVFKSQWPIIKINW